MNHFRELRLKAGYKSQADLAKVLFVNQTAVSQWERGVTIPSPPILLKLSQMYGVSTDYLLGKSGDSAPTDDTIKAAFFEGGEDLSQEEMDELWADAKDYIQYKLAQRRRKQDGQ